MTVPPAAGVLPVILVWLSSGVACAHAQSDSAAQQAVRSMEQRWLGAEDDPDTLETILADDFIHVLPAGFVTKREQIAYLRSHPLQGPGARRFADLRVRIFGSSGVATGIVVASSADGRTRRTAFTDVFARRNGRWQAVSAQELPLAAPVPGEGSAAGPPPGARRDIAAGNQAWIDGLEAGDAVRAASAFAPDAVSCGASGTCASGIAAIRAGYRDLIARLGRATAAVVRSEALRVDHDLAYESGYSEARFPHGAVHRGRFSTVWKLEPGGHWKILRNMGLPPASP